MTWTEEVWRDDEFAPVLLVARPERGVRDDELAPALCGDRADDWLVVESNKSVRAAMAGRAAAA